MSLSLTEDFACVPVGREMVLRSLQQVFPDLTKTQIAHPPAAHSPQVTTDIRFYKFSVILIGMFHLSCGMFHLSCE